MWEVKVVDNPEPPELIYTRRRLWTLENPMKKNEKDEKRNTAPYSRWELRPKDEPEDLIGRRIIVVGELDFLSNFRLY